MPSDKSILPVETLLTDFDRTYIMYYARVRRFVTEYSFSEHDTEDIVQEVFVTIWNRRDSLDFNDNISSYLLKTAKSKCIDYIRHKAAVKKYQKECAIRQTSLEQIPDYNLSESQLSALLQEAVDTLPPRCREVFVKSRFENKKNKEISEEMNISESTVENQMTIAIKRISSYLKDYLPLLVFFL